MMPQLHNTLTLAATPADVFTLLSDPNEIVHLSPPDRPIQLVDGPTQIEQGSVLTWRGKRWGMAHHMVVEVAEYQPNERLVWEQQRGTLKAFRHEQRFTKVDEGMQLDDEITFEPPGGLLGLTVTEKVVLEELQEGLRYRDEVLRGQFSD